MIIKILDFTDKNGTNCHYEDCSTVFVDENGQTVPYSKYDFTRRGYDVLEKGDKFLKKVTLDKIAIDNS